MIQYYGVKAEGVFTNLPKQGYSDKASRAIFDWYHR